MAEVSGETGPAIDLRQKVGDTGGGQPGVTGKREAAPAIAIGIVRWLPGEAQPVALEKYGVALTEVALDREEGRVEAVRAFIEPGMHITGQDRWPGRSAWCRCQQCAQRAMHLCGRNPDIARRQRTRERLVGRHFPGSAVDRTGVSDMTPPAPFDMTERHVVRQRPAPVAIEVGEDRHRRPQALRMRPSLEVERTQERRTAALEGAVFRRDLAQYVVAVRRCGAPDDRGIGIERIERRDPVDGCAHILAGACRFGYRLEQDRDAEQAFAPFPVRHGDPLLEPLARPQAGPADQGAEHGDRRVGERRLHLAQGGEQHGPATGGSHLLKGLRGVA
ncbi:hypothetical protein ABIC44_002697 [Sphingomonas sp. 1185]